MLSLAYMRKRNNLIVSYVLHMASNVMCLSLSIKSRKYRLLRSIAVIEAKQCTICVSLTLFSFRDSLCMCAFILLVVNRDFFCGDLTVSYTLLLFTSRYKISLFFELYRAFSFFFASFILSFFLTVGKYENVEPHFSQMPIENNKPATEP